MLLTLLPSAKINLPNALTGPAFEDNVDAQCLTAGDKKKKRKEKETEKVDA